MECKLKHLEMIQAIITRMASNSFLLKGWSVTLVSALFALAAKDSNSFFISVAYIPCICFWILDAYFLRQERLYRALYNSIRLKKEADIDFNMDTQLFLTTVESWGTTLLSITLRVFHGVVLATVIVVSTASIVYGR